MNQSQKNKKQSQKQKDRNLYRRNGLLYGFVAIVAVILAGILCFERQSYAIWIEEENGMKYLQDDGQYAIGFVDIEDKRYYFDIDGHLVTGKFYVEEDDAYYYSDESGVLQYGAIQTEDDFFITDDTGKLQTGFVEYEKNKYFFNEIAQLVVGWFKYEEDWYYASSTGVIQTGFVDVDGYRYYLNEDGTRTNASLLEIDGKIYIFNEDGSVDDNATETYPIFQHINNMRKSYGCSDVELNSKVQSCALLRASDLVNGFSLENAESLEKLLGNRGVRCSGGYEFAYGGIEDYNFERLVADMQKDMNMKRVLSDSNVSEIGIGMKEQDGLLYYSIIFITSVLLDDAGEENS